MHRKRHPIFEGLVFGLAGLLALIIAVAALSRLLESRRRAAAAQANLYASPMSQGGYGQDVPEGGNLVHSGTEESPSSSPSAAVTYSAPERVAAPTVPKPE